MALLTTASIWTITIGLQVSPLIPHSWGTMLNITVDEILHSFLPEELREGAPSGFAMVGHIGTHNDICCVILELIEVMQPT